MKTPWRKLKQAVRKLIAPKSKAESERLRLVEMPRYVETITDLLGFTIKIPDAASFLASWEEIFNREIYNFNHPNAAPRILDCGANIGISCLYFRRRFPQAKITAFEPDPDIFAFLKENLAGAGCGDIELVAKGVWSSDTTLKFHSEGSDAGRIDTSIGCNGIKIPTVRLCDYLSESIDLLKIDIEGAETKVILDIVPCLANVRNIFVEYHSFAGQAQTLGKLVQALSDAGFRVQIQPVCVSPQPFLKVDTNLGMDMQLNIFGYRMQPES